MPALPGPGAIGPPDGTAADGMHDDSGNSISAALAAEQAAADIDADEPFASGGLHPNQHSAEPGSPAAGPADDPGWREAAAVVRDYYAALGNRDFNRAYRLWSDNGEASSRSPRQFKDSFSGTASWSLEVLPPEHAGGSRYIEVPVAVEEVALDGSVRRQIGAYTLRRVTVDERGTQRRTWRISSADLRVVRP